MESFLFDITGLPTSPNFINGSLWAGIIHNEVLRQCDTIDGVIDGIIDDPTLCKFRPEALECPMNNIPGVGCLRLAQFKILRRIFSPLYGSSSELVFPAMQPGSELLASQKLYAGAPFPYSLVCLFRASDPETWRVASNVGQD